MKKKQEIVIKCQDQDQFNKYMNADSNKIVVVNVYDKYWGPCEVADQMVKRFLDTGSNASKTDFISADKDLAGEQFSKMQFYSKPKFFLFHKLNLISSVDGVDLPKLQEEIEKNFNLLDG